MSVAIKLSGKESGQTKTIEAGSEPIIIEEPSDIYLPETDRSDVQSEQQVGDDLVLTLTSGQIIVFEGFFDQNDEDEGSQLVFSDDGALSTADALGASAWVAGGLALASGGSSSSGGSEPIDRTPPTTPSVSQESGSVFVDLPGDASTVFVDYTRADGTVSRLELQREEERYVEPESGLPDGFTLDSDGLTIENSALEDGSDVTVTAVDSSGSESVGSLPDGGVDSLAPDAPEIASENADRLSGTAEPGSSVTLFDNEGNVVATVEADAETGEYSFEPNPLSDGESGTVTATDAVGNESIATAVGPVDAIAPRAPRVDRANADTLEGTSEPSSTVTLFDDAGNELDSVVADSVTGDYRFSPNPLADGESGTVTATDAAGNESGATAVGPVDAIAPSAPMVDTVNGDTLEGTSEPGSTVTLFDDAGNDLDSVAADPVTGEYSFEPNPLADGESGTVTATDAAGNESDATSVGPVDAIAPSAPTVDTENADTLEGTSAPGSTVTLFDDAGNELDSVVADPDTGIYSFSPNPLADGESGTVTATDAVGNESRATAVGPVDAIAPTAPRVDAVNADTLDGTAEPGSTVTLFDEAGNELDSGVADPDTGSYSFSPNPLADGESGTVTATDAAGNESSASAVSPVDAVAPSAPTVDKVNDNTLEGISEPGSTVTLFDDAGNEVDRVEADPVTGEYSFQPNPLADGESGTVTATDAAGNESGGASVGTVDAIAPGEPTVDTVNADTLEGMSEPGSTVTLFDDAGNELGSVVADPDTGDYSFAPNPLADGQSGTVTATDAAGNESGATDVEPVDAIAPSAPTVDTVNADTLGGTSELGSSVTLFDDAGNELDSVVADPVTGAYRIAPNPLADGESGTVTATDAAGNESDATAVGPVDAIAPISPTVDTENAEILEGTTDPGSTVTLFDDAGNELDSVVADPDTGNYSFAPNPLADGESGTVTATDAAGNESSATAVGPVDAIAPMAPRVDMVNADTLEGTSEPGSTVTLFDDTGNELGSVVADPDTGDYSFAPNPMSDGESGTVTATDSAGNESGATAVGPVDAIAPSAPTADTLNGDTLGGTSEPGSTVTLFDDAGNDLDSVAADPVTGEYSFEPNPLADGESGTVTATDAAGNESDPTSVGPVDAIAPSAPTVDTENADTLEGTSEPGSTVTLFDGSGNELDSVVADPVTGDYSFESNPLADGESGTLTATDAVGNESRPTAVGPVDAIAPTAPRVDAVNADTLEGTAEPSSTVTLFDDAGNELASVVADSVTGDYRFSPNPLADGESGTVTATDAADNESNATTVNAVDAVAPSAPLVDTENADALSGTAEPGSTVTLFNEAGDEVATATADPDTGEYSFEPNPLADGESGTITATDAAGNESNSTVIGPVDATDPVAPTVVTENADALSGTAEPGSTVTLFNEVGDEVATATADPDTGEYSFEPNPLADGESGTITVTDEAGNESDATSVGPVDATDPVVPTVDTENADQLSGTAEPGSTVTLFDETGVEVATATADPDTGEYSFEPNPLADGESGTITATDEAGNESNSTAIGPVDATDPVVPTVDTENADQLSGTAEPGNTVTLFNEAGDEVATATADPDTGDYSFEPNPLADGESGTITATDEAGNESDATSVGPVDATDPAAPTVDTESADRLSGTAEPGATVTLFDEAGDEVATAVADPDTGDFSFEPNPLGDGSTGSVTATDAAGNESAVTSFSPDAPVNAVPEAVSVDEDTESAIEGVNVSDSDGNLASTELSVSNGTLSVDVSGGATISAGADNSVGLTLSGTEAQISAALSTLSYVSNQDYNGPDTLTVVSTDTGGLSDTDTVDITVNPVNDPAVVSGATSGDVTEADPGSTDSTTGALTATDVDNDDNVFQTTVQSVNAAAGNPSYGALNIDSNGNWTYTLDDSGVNEDLRLLRQGETATDVFTVQTQDGTEQDITITVAGIDNAGGFDGSNSADNISLFSDGQAAPGDAIVAGQSDFEGDQVTTGDDVINGYGGDDVIAAYQGFNSIDGGAGADTVDYSWASNAVEVDLSAGVGKHEFLDSVIGDQFTVNTTTAGNQSPALVMALEDGGYFSAWYDDSNLNTAGVVRGQFLNADGTKNGSEFQIGTARVAGSNFNEMPPLTVEKLANGSIVVGWQSTSNDAGLTDGSAAAAVQSIIDPVTQTAGPQSLINTTASGSQSAPVVTTLEDGGYFATWYDNATDNPAGQVYGQFFNSDGSKNGTELTLGGPRVSGFDGLRVPPLSAATLENGDVVVTWRSTTFDDGLTGGDGPDVFQVLVDSETQTPNDGSLVNTVTSGDQSSPIVVGLADGGYFITWYDNVGSEQVQAQYFNADGTKDGSQFSVGSSRVESDTRSASPQLSATELSNGDLVVGWISSPDDAAQTDGEGTAAVQVLIDSAQRTQGDETVVNTTAATSQSAPVFAALDSGGYFAVWYDSVFAEPSGQIRGQYFNADGTKLGDELDIGTARVAGSDDIDMPPLSATALANDDVVISWVASAPDAIDGSGFAPAQVIAKSPREIDELDNLENIVGSDFGDRLVGDANDNVIDAGSGDDVVSGGGGNDVIIFGDGNDVLDFSLIDPEDNVGGNGLTTITDFQLGDPAVVNDADTIDLSGLLDDSATLGNLGDFVTTDSDGTDTTLSIDRDGSGGEFASDPLVVLSNVDTDLQSLLDDNQVVI